jgi:hypothetical protein
MMKAGSSKFRQSPCNSERDASFDDCRGGELVHSMDEAVSCLMLARLQFRLQTRAISQHTQRGGGDGCFGFGPNARVVSRCGRLTLDRAN